MYEVKIKKFRWPWEVSLNICEIGIYLSATSSWILNILYAKKQMGIP
jgi:hypothetical protein